MKVENIDWDGFNVLTSDGSVFHKLKEARLRDLILIEDVEEFEDELQVFILFLIDKGIHCLVVVGQVYHDLEVVLEAR